MDVRRECFRIIQGADPQKAQAWAPSVIAPNRRFAPMAPIDVMSALLRLRHHGALKGSFEELDLSGFKERVDHESASGLILAFGAMTAMNEHGGIQEPIPNLAAKTTALKFFSHQTQINNEECSKPASIKSKRGACVSTSECADGLPSDSNGVPGEIRTHDLQLRRLTLYPAELRARPWIAFLVYRSPKAGSKIKRAAARKGRCPLGHESRPPAQRAQSPLTFPSKARRRAVVDDPWRERPVF